MKFKSLPLTIVNGVILLTILSYLIFSFFYKENNDVVYVDNVKLFSSFNMAQELNKLHQRDIKKQKNTVDSIVQILQSYKESNPNIELQGLFVRENNKLKEMGDYFTGTASQQVWDRLNSYMQEYGKEKNYAIVLGTQGNGNLMYGKITLDITDDFIEYANRKYEGQ